MTPLEIMIGYDSREVVAWHVCAHSIMSRASGPVSIIPISLSTLDGIYIREPNSGQSTEFTFSRFLTPYLAKQNMTSIFMDSDMLVLCDIYELVEQAKRQPYSDVLVVKHDYTPKTSEKFLGQKQTNYPCKNWSSLMVFNGYRSATKRLTPDYVNKASPMDLHQFKWAEAVGDLPIEYNHLVGEYEYNSDAKIVHYTLGTPCFDEFSNSQYSGEWRDEFNDMTYSKN